MNIIADPLWQQARLRPEAVFLVPENGTAWTYRGALQRVEEVSAHLSDKGVKRGTVVACLLTESADSMIFILSLIRMGAILAPLPFPQPKAVLKKQMDRLGAACLVYSTTMKGVAREIASSQKKIELDQGLLVGGGFRKEIDKKKMVWDLGRSFSRLFTSGSSGEPKIAGHRLGDFWSSALASNQRVPFKKDDVWLFRLPLFHVGGLSILFRALASGGSIYFPKDRSDVAGSLASVTHLSLVATQLRRLLEKDSVTRRLGGLKAVLLGGGPVPADLVELCQKRKINLFASYGLTEMSSQVATSKISLRHTDFLVPLEKVKVRISRSGEILVKGPSLFQGYWEDGKWEKPFDRQGYFHTGDHGMMNARGCVKIAGRMDGLIISGGENIQPQEIELALFECFPLVEAIVVGVPDKTYGSRPAAFLKWTNKKTNVKKIRERLGSRLAPFKIPDHFWDWPENEEIFRKGIKWSRSLLAKEAARRVQERSGPK